jgi:hypothetical protein
MGVYLKKNRKEYNNKNVENAQGEKIVQSMHDMNGGFVVLSNYW